MVFSTLQYIFLSTLSAWRATHGMIYSYQAYRFLSTLSAWRATTLGTVNWQGQIISIHALRMESDRSFCAIKITSKLFLSTLSAWRATITAGVVFLHFQNFYPRSPHGERQILFKKYVEYKTFLSTLSAWRATAADCN